MAPPVAPKGGNVDQQTGKRLIPSGSTYKLRRHQYAYQGVRVFPSYLQTGKSFLIEKSKQKMIAEDIRAALGLLQVRG